MRRTSDASDLTPEQRAEQAAMRQLQQIDARITIKASVAEITFTDALWCSERYVINDKTSEMFVRSSPVKVKSKWDKQVLKQEFEPAGEARADVERRRFDIAWC